MSPVSIFEICHTCCAPGLQMERLSISVHGSLQYAKGTQLPGSCDPVTMLRNVPARSSQHRPRTHPHDRKRSAVLPLPHEGALCPSFAASPAPGKSAVQRPSSRRPMN
mmetsp:Transcript_22877/g.35452  ORF Transcript_22877/g.35452 Transcript_22877/m.35452 type:complete len:108 (-) Transcript_22877:253-576(-)